MKRIYNCYFGPSPNPLSSPFLPLFTEIVRFRNGIGHFVTFMKKDRFGHLSFQKFGVLLRVV